EWIAIMPFILNKKGPFSFLPQGPLSQYWGICFREEEARPYQLQSRYTKIIQLIAEKIQAIELISFNLSPDFPYLLPFHWEGFEIRPRFSFQVALNTSEEILYEQVAPSHKRQIRKSEKYKHTLNLSVFFQDFEQLFLLNQASGNDLSAGDPRILPLLKEIHSYLIASKQGNLQVIQNAEGKVLAAALFADACGKRHYLSGAYHPEYMSSGAMTHLLWLGILQAQNLGLMVFDFEGSMIPGIAQFFRKFGASPISYFQLYKNNLPLWAKWLHKLLS
ncbi:MAG: GNAT family N-acetyltransferase, partial [Bacteroidota bacterium]